MFCLKWDNIDWSAFLTKVLWINVEMVRGWHGFAKAKTQIKNGFFCSFLSFRSMIKSKSFFQELIPLSVSIFCVRRGGHKRIFSRSFGTIGARVIFFIIIFHLFCDGFSNAVSSELKLYVDKALWAPCFWARSQMKFLVSFVFNSHFNM